MRSARWQSGYAAACKAVYVGSIPARASKYPSSISRAVPCSKARSDAGFLTCGDGFRATVYSAAAEARKVDRLMTDCTASVRRLGPGDGIGRRSGLKIRSRKACGFKSRPGYQQEISNV